VGRYGELLREIAKSKAQLGIVNYGLNATTLSEVFLKVAEIADLEEENQMLMDEIAKAQDGGDIARALDQAGNDEAK
jgi:hypothetical protein